MIFHTDSSTYLVERIMNVIFHTQLFELVAKCTILYDFSYRFID